MVQMVPDAQTLIVGVHVRLPFCIKSSLCDFVKNRSVQLLSAKITNPNIYLALT